MRDQYYTAYVRLEVLRVDVPTDDAAGADTDRAPSPRMVATRVLSAYCECKSGADSLCHHIAVTLQLGRLLKMTARDIAEFDPVTVTGVQCKWILDHQSGGREAERNMWWGRTLSDISAEYCLMRDPKGQSFGADLVTPMATSGVVQGGRAENYCAHPTLGRWALPRKYFDEGTSICASQNAAFAAFFASVKAAKKSAARKTVSTEKTYYLAVDVLPALVRADVEMI